MGLFRISMVLLAFALVVYGIAKLVVAYGIFQILVYCFIFFSVGALSLISFKLLKVGMA